MSTADGGDTVGWGGCGKSVHVIGTNGGTIPCGAQFRSKQYLCAECRVFVLGKHLRLIRQYCGENVAGLSIEARNKALIVTIPVIVDHALGDGISGTDEAWSALAQAGVKQDG